MVTDLTTSTKEMCWGMLGHITKCFEQKPLRIIFVLFFCDFVILGYVDFSFFQNNVSANFLPSKYLFLLSAKKMGHKFFWGIFSF